MVECSRCGFIQPDDRYCANCGLDSLTYTPKPIPLYLRILNNTGVQLTAALLIVASLIFGLYKNQQAHVELAINQAEEGRRQNPTATTTSAKILPSRPTETAKSAPKETSKTAEPVMAASMDLAAKESAGPADDDETDNASVHGAAAAAVVDTEGKTIAFTVSLVELSKDVLAGLAQVKPIKTWTQTRAWLISNFQGGQELATFSQNLPAGQKWSIDIPNTERGLQLTVVPLAGSTESRLKVQVRTYFHWPTANSGESKGNEMTIEGPFEIPSQSHLVITGILRHVRNLSMSEATLIQDTPLALLATEGFQNNSTELALTIQ